MKHRTAMGKMLDMGALRTKNEKVRAVGNMNCNARGDTIDSNDNIIEDNTKRVNQHYMRSVIKQQPQNKQRSQVSQTIKTDNNTRESYNPSADIDDDVPNPKKN
jgi:hypothetical protein